jgi:transposase
LLETIDKEPQELGYEFGRWTGERLATYLASKTGIELSGSQVSRILKKKKYSYIWAKYSREYQQNPAQRTKFNQKLLNYLHRAREQHFCHYRYGFGMRAGLVYES